jgi:hypothetical protein
MYDQLDDISDTDDEAEENKELRGTLDNGLGNDDGNRMDEEDANSFYDEFKETDMQTGMLTNGALASDEEKDVAAWSDEETPEDQRAILSKEKNAVTRERAMQEVPIILDAIATASKRSGADKTYFMKLLSALDNSPKAKAPHRWNLFNALFKSVTGRAYLVKFTNNHFKKRESTFL